MAIAVIPNQSNSQPNQNVYHYCLSIATTQKSWMNLSSIVSEKVFISLFVSNYQWT